MKFDAILTLFIAILLLPVSVLAGNSVTSSKSQSDHTDLRMLTPFTAQGLNPKLTITKRATGTCWTTSQVDSHRPNTWRCQADNTVYDPCFKNPTREDNVVACMKSPWDKSVVLITLTSPLPATHSHNIDMHHSEPWALELTNGKLCVLSTGPSVKIAGMQAKYTCGSGAIVIGEIHRKQHHKWSAFFLENESLYMSETAINSAWY